MDKELLTDVQHELNGDDKHIYNLYMKMLDDDKITIDQMEHYELDLVCKTLIDRFTTTEIVTKPTKFTNSWRVYNCFKKWMHDHNINDTLKNHFSQSTFDNYFAESHDQKSIGSGKVWNDIVLKNDKIDKSYGHLMGLLMKKIYEVTDPKIKFLDHTILTHNINFIKKYTYDLFEESDKTFFLHHWNYSDIARPLKLIITGTLNDIHKLRRLIINEKCIDSWFQTFFINGFISYSYLDNFGFLPIDLLLLLPTSKITRIKDDVYSCCLVLSCLPYFFTPSHKSKCFIIEKSDDSYFKNMKIELIAETVVFDVALLHDIRNNPHYQLSCCINTYSNFTITPNNGDTVYRLILGDTDNTYFHRFIKGYFIKCNDINNIKNIILQVNGHDFLDYNKVMIDNVCHRLSNNLLYVPLDNEKKYDDYEMSSYTTYIKCSETWTFYMYIKFTGIKEDIQMTIYDNAGCITTTTPESAPVNM